MYEPYGLNGVRQMGGDHVGVHKESLIGRTCVCVPWFVFEFLDKRFGSGYTLHSQLVHCFFGMNLKLFIY